MMSRHPETGEWFLNPEKVREFVPPAAESSSSNNGANNLVMDAAMNASLLSPYMARGTPRVKTQPPTEWDYFHQMEAAERRERRQRDMEASVSGSAEQSTSTENADGHQQQEDPWAAVAAERAQWTRMAVETVNSHGLIGKEEPRDGIFAKSKSLGRWGA